MSPYYVCWYMTERCNLHCPFCYAFRNRQDSSLEQLRTVAYALSSQNVRKVNLMGGEPFLQEHFLDIISEFCSIFDLSITSNGTLITKDALRILEGKIERLTISLDTVDSQIGRILRGEKYHIDTVLNIVQEVLQFDIPLKINTVITKNNISALLNLGIFLANLKKPVVWKLFELTKNQNVSMDLISLQPNHYEIRKSIDNLLRTFPEMSIHFADSTELNSHYLIVRANGDVHIPSIKGYGKITNALDFDLQQILHGLRFDFIANTQIYELRNPISLCSITNLITEEGRLDQ